MTRKNKKTFFITVRLTFRGIQLPLRDSILVLFQLLINAQFLSKKKKIIKSLNRQFREIKSPANTIFLRDREIKDSRNVPRKFSQNLSPAKIKENKVVKPTRVTLISITATKKSYTKNLILKI